MTTEINVTGQTVSANGRVITLQYTRAPEPDESMDARDWARVKAEYLGTARKLIAQHGKSVEIYASAPDCQDWMLENIEAEAES